VKTIPGFVVLVALLFTTGFASPGHAGVVSPCNGSTTLQQGLTDPLIGAAGSGLLEEVKRLIREGHDINYQECEDVSRSDGTVLGIRGWTPLMIAAMHAHLDVVRFLVGAGAKLETKTSNGETALALARRAERAEAVALLKELGATK